MLDVAWPELLVIGAVALVAIGPKDMPKVMRVMGRWVGKAQRLVREISDHMQRLEYESRVADDVRAADRETRAAERASTPDAKGGDRDG